MTERLTKKDIEEIKKLDILSYFKNYQPEELIRMGRNNNYCLRSHQSIKLSNGLWCWWGNGKIGGKTALDYLIKVEGYDFKDACFYLRDLMRDLPPVMEVPHAPKREAPFRLPRRSDSNAIVRRYLIDERGLDPDLVDDLMREGKIYEEADSHNAVFVGDNDIGLPAYAFKRSTSDNRKMEAFGSCKAFSFRLLNPESEDLHIFEGAIDLLSFISIAKYLDLPWEDKGYLSLGGISDGKDIPLALIKYLEHCPKTRNMYTHFDLDNAGVKASASLKQNLDGLFNVEDKTCVLCKDVNEQLQNIRKGNKTYEQVFSQSY